MNTNEQFNLNKCPICKNALKYHTETPIEVPPEAPLYNPINTYSNGLEDDDDLRNNGLDDDDLINEDEVRNKFKFLVIKYTFIQFVVQFPITMMLANSLKKVI